MKPTMHDGIPVDGPPRQARPPVIQIALVILATAAMALLAAACSSPSSAGAGSPSAAAGSSATAQSAVAYSQCMRANGVPKYPDPASGGQLPKGDAQAFGVSDSQFQAAQHTCQHLLPTGGSFDEQAQECIQAGDCPPALVQQMLTADRKFAQCMRSHGVPNWPDPTLGENGGPVFIVSAAGITHTQTHSPPMENTIMACLRSDPAPVAMG
jgi:hypothetical protein